MKIRCIFEKVKGKLFAMCFQHNPFIGISEFNSDDTNNDELDRAFYQWKDVEWLRDFFIQYRSDLHNYDSTLTVKAAIRQVMDEAEKIYDCLVESDSHKLQQLFKPLDNRETLSITYNYQKLKAKGERRKSMIRLYAVKLDEAYVITGGAIKLTDRMRDRPHLTEELYKLELTRTYLQDESEQASFVFMASE